MSTRTTPTTTPRGGDDDLSGGVSADEAAWRSIVDNYGDRPELEPTSPRSSVPSVAARRLPRGAARATGAARRAPEDHFVPPPPPPLPLPGPTAAARLAGPVRRADASCWCCCVTGLDLPTWLGLILMVWFVGGFVYLVASMRPGAGDDYDDGAVL